jgi:cation:H+ antiporter
MFNTLAVVGIAGTIHPFAVEPETLSRDMVVMGALTVSLFLIGYGFGGRKGRINRFEGAVLLLVYAGYTAWLIRKVIMVQTG